MLQTIVSTCVANGVKPRDYLADLLIRAQTHGASHIDEVLPMTWAATVAEVSDIPAFLRALDDGLRSDESLRTDLVGRGELILGGNGRVAVFASVWRAFIDGFQGLTVPWPGASWRAGDAVRRAADADSDTMART